MPDRNIRINWRQLNIVEFLKAANPESELDPVVWDKCMDFAVAEWPRRDVENAIAVILSDETVLMAASEYRCYFAETSWAEAPEFYIGSPADDASRAELRKIRENAIWERGF